MHISFDCRGRPHARGKQTLFMDYDMALSNLNEALMYWIHLVEINNNNCNNNNNTNAHNREERKWP